MSLDMATSLPSHRKLNLLRFDGESQSRPQSLQHPLSPHAIPNKPTSPPNGHRYQNDHTPSQAQDDILPYSHPLSPHATCPEDDQAQCVNDPDTHANAHAATPVAFKENVAMHPLSPHGLSIDQDLDHIHDHSHYQANNMISQRANSQSSSSAVTSSSVAAHQIYTPSTSTSSTTTPADITCSANTTATTVHRANEPNTSTRTILLINGPNLNLLGHREPAIYGSTTLQDITTNLTTKAASHGITLHHFQSNHEGEILDRIHACMLGSTPTPQTSPETHTPRQQPSTQPTPTPLPTPKPDAIIINPGAFTHTSIALRDALLGISTPFVEVHISNVHAREQFRHTSYLSDKAAAVIAGLGTYGYEAALNYWVTQWHTTTK